jgi:hypothetical protein
MLPVCFEKEYSEYHVEQFMTTNKKKTFHWVSMADSEGLHNRNGSVQKAGNSLRGCGGIAVFHP